MINNNIMGGGKFTNLNLSKATNGDDNFIWDTEKVNALLHEITVEGRDIRSIKRSPFKDNDILLKKANLPFQYTKEEWEELEKCKKDPLYFAENYAFIRTSKGDMLTKDAGGLRDYQVQIIKNMHNHNYNILMASRQTGKTVTTAIYMMWYILFNKQKNVLMVADNISTTKEIMEKLRIVHDNLPFFMKPGIVKVNESSMRLDNECRLILRTTTKKSGIGLTVNFLYIDEFAHIDGSKLDKFYRAILPVITEDPNGKVMITSTPNGRNKFWELWKDAVDGVSEFKPMRVDWWQVPGRDEEWKRKTIANFGTEADFNQEYGLQFFTSDQLLLSSRDLRKLDNIKTEYVKANLDFDSDRAIINQYLTVHPKYKDRTIEDWKNDDSYYVLSIDTADGVEGGDFSVINIFKVVALPVEELLKKKDTIRNELDTISLVQVAKFRSNKFDISEFATIASTLVYDVMNFERVRVVLEVNHKGDIVHLRMAQNDNYWKSQFIHTHHTQLAKGYKLGLRLGPVNKLKYCEKFRYYVSINKIIPNDMDTYMELSSFGKSKSGQYRGQNGNDDLSMTCVNVSSFFESPQFWDVATSVYETTSEKYRKEFTDKILNAVMDNMSNNNRYDVKSIQELNRGMTNPSDRSSNSNDLSKNTVVDPETYYRMLNIHKKFFKN